MKKRTGLIFTALGLLYSLSWAHAQDIQKNGRETGLPIPRYISLNSSETNMRRGPSQDYPIEYIYHHKGYPVKIIGESGHWRKAEDPNGAIGWFHYALLSGRRTVLILQDRSPLREAASENAQLVAILNKNVIAKLVACSANWCEVEIERLSGWLPKSVIWGVDEGEVFEK